MATSARPVYVVNINGDQFRIPAENSFVRMHKIREDIKTRFNIDYDFDLIYKGSKVLDTTSLEDNCFDDCTPLVVVRKDVESLNEGQRNLVRSNSLPRQISRPMAIHKVLSLDQLYEEEIEDETEPPSNRSIVSTEGFQWKPTIIYIAPAPSVNDEQINLSFQASMNSPSSSRSRPSTLIEPIDRTTHEPTSSTLSPPFSRAVQPTMPSNPLRITNNRSPIRQQQATVTLSVQRNSPLTTVDITNKVNSTENLSDTGNLNSSIHHN